MLELIFYTENLPDRLVWMRLYVPGNAGNAYSIVSQWRIWLSLNVLVKGMACMMVRGQPAQKKLWIVAIPCNSDRIRIGGPVASAAVPCAS